MEISQIIPHIESLIFAADRPLPLLDILDMLNNALAFLEDRATLEQVEASLEAIKEKYSTEFYAFEVRESGGGYQFLTKKEYYQTVAQLNGDKFLKRLSTAALETLAIVAYKQPISKGEIEHIRGVSTDYSIQKLLEKELIVITGRSENLPGKPLLYATSKAFMDYFGLNSPKDLPKLKEVFDDESIQPTLIGLEGEAGSDEEARNMVVSENGELVEQNEDGEGPEAHLNGRKVSSEEIPVADTSDKKNNDLQAKLFLPFDEEVPQDEEKGADDIVKTDDDSDTGSDDIIAGTEIPTMDEALGEEETVEEEATTITENTEEEEEVTYATDEELAAFMNAAADVVPDGEDEDDDEDDESEEDEDDGDDEDNDDDEDDEDDSEEDDDDDIDEEDADSDDDDEDSDDKDNDDEEDDEEDSEEDDNDDTDEEDTDSDDDDEDSDEDEENDSDEDDEDDESDDDDVNDDEKQEAMDKENDDAAFAAAAKEDFDGEDIDDEDFDEDNFEDDDEEDDERR